ncbi:MAG TPA: glutamate--tRNA ligase [Nitrososphaerales archaeon]|nr:glutamate--tRNA ligase [Nitrososphaerales archaeon]
MVKSASSLPPEAISSIEKHSLVNASQHGGKADAGAVMGRVLGEFPQLRADPGLVAKEVAVAVRRVNSMGASEQASLLAAKFPDAIEHRQKEPEVRELPALANAVKGKAAFRLPPEPSGFMTIGHAMAFTINYLYKEMYDGELWLRFEDTNPKRAARRYYDSFRTGIRWLGISTDHEKNLSDDNELIYGYGRRLLEKGDAYACSCDLQKVKKDRFDGKPCVHRQQGTDANLRVWDEMLARKHKEGTYVIRLRGDMSSLDYSLRDPNIFRIIEHEHPMQGSKYVVWPTYNLANAIEDEVCGITHILRSTEFPVALQELIREKLSLKKVEVTQFTRFNFKGTPVHKRLLRPLVEEGLVSGWDDPRMPTVDGVRRRGILPQTIRQFTLHVGYTKAEHEYDWSMLFSLNRKLLDPVSKRVFFVPNPVGLKVEGAPSRRVAIPFHPDKDLGSRTIETGDEFYVPSDDLTAIKKGAVFRLMDLYNVELVSGGKSPVAKYAGDKLLPDTKKLQWVTPSHANVMVLVPDLLYDDDGEFNKESLKETAGFAEESVSALKVGDIVQFPRFGFCRLDSPGSFILAHR